MDGAGALPAGVRGFGRCHVRDTSRFAEVGGLIGVEEEVETVTYVTLPSPNRLRLVPLAVASAPGAGAAFPRLRTLWRSACERGSQRRSRLSRT